MAQSKGKGKGKVKRKTHKGLAKRVRVSARGKVNRKASFGGHLMSGKSGKRCRKVTSTVLMSDADNRRSLDALAGQRP